MNITEQAIGPWTMIWMRVRKNRFAMAGFSIFIFLLFISAFAPILTPYGRDTMDFKAIHSPPSFQHWLGTDELGRDYLTRILYGGQVSLKVGVIAVSISVIIGTIVGGIAGYYGGSIDNIIMRLLEIWSSFPFLPLAITTSALLSNRVDPENKIYALMLLIGVLSWPGLARMVRAQILSLRKQEFMQAATALGISDMKKIFKHLIPNTYGYIIVTATLSMGDAILIESALSFLGLGVVPPTPTWGNLVSYCRELYTLQNRPWLWIPPGMMIFLAIVSINLLGDGLRDAVDPKSKR